MKVITADLPREISELELRVFADWHIGDKRCDMASIQKEIETVRDNPNAYCILNGDILNNATKTSISDSYSETLSPMQEIQRGVDLLRPIQDKVIAILTGNHERRTYKKEGIDLTAIMAAELGLRDRFSPEGAYIFIRFGENRKAMRKTKGGYEYIKMMYQIYVTHGTGGGRKEGAKAIRLADLANIVDADVYIHGHTHLPLVMKQNYFRAAEGRQVITPVTRLFVNTAAKLDYGGYGEINGYKPAAKESPVIYLSSKRKQADARL